MHFDDIGVCFDCGHAHMMNGIPEAFATLKNHICSTHVHDNNQRQRLAPLARQRLDRLESRPWNCCAPRRKSRPCCSKSTAKKKKNPSEELAAAFRKLEDS